MWTSLTRLREPMTLAGVFTLGAVSLGLRFLPPDVLPAAAAALAGYAAGFFLFALAPEPWHRPRLFALLAMAGLALLLASLTPRLGTAQVLLVIWVACATNLLSPRWVIAAALLLNVAFYFLMVHHGFGAPGTMTLINIGFQALAGLCVFYARRSEESRDALARVNADLLATRALLADSARDAERLRVARELHDVAGHKLTAMKINLRALASDPALAGREEVRIAQQLSTELLDDIRSVVQAMRDARGLDLQTAIRALAAPLPRPALDLRIGEGVQIADPAVAESLLRIVQECLTNAARHANADTLTVSLQKEDAGMHLHIEDDGRLKGRVREGNGLSGIRERVAALGGDLRLGSSATGGLRVDVRLPA
ncbi:MULTISPECIES: sensor histidine kinase [unclassified Pseudoxanthomonas]|uniref:sensor histidine kinase n=1 Tax=unclassified Pseudoxanthomonas TaxID=2645906 RepID=UPI0008E3D714|nr:MULTISPECIES: sensor histidine kinase [unclassified Pseudoxanthomonas]PPJ40948.1 sensor histidine kinase [Pseudoxanthomonas sp. KAs_5_3]SFV31695.1 Signal transduction histidine kinase [Pseudoxanthomonas sp. YR558]